MWQSIERMLTSPNAAIILIFLSFSAVIIFILSKTGLLQVHTDNLQLGAANQERDIIRQQVEWVTLHYEGMENTMHKPDGYDPWRGKYITERVIDEVVNWIIYNHINASDTYIEVKQDKILNILKKYTELEYFTSPDFVNFIKDDTKKTIMKLIQIREIYRRQTI